jgi:glycogen operon protein
LRTRQIKNLDTLEMLSRGTPLIEAGDEVRHTTGGDNNYWNQEAANNFPWNNVQSESGISNFLKGVINLRQQTKIGELKPDAYTFLGSNATKSPDWNPNDRSLNFLIKPIDAQHQPLYVASNAYWEPLQISVPKGSWTQVLNTSLPSGQDIVSGDKAPAVGANLTVPARTTIVLQGKAA